MLPELLWEMPSIDVLHCSAEDRISDLDLPRVVSPFDASILRQEFFHFHRSRILDGAEEEESGFGISRKKSDGIQHWSWILLVTEEEE